MPLPALAPSQPAGSVAPVTALAPPASNQATSLVQQTLGLLGSGGPPGGGPLPPGGGPGSGGGLGGLGGGGGLGGLGGGGLLGGGPGSPGGGGGLGPIVTGLIGGSGGAVSQLVQNVSSVLAPILPTGGGGGGPTGGIVQPIVEQLAPSVAPIAGLLNQLVGETISIVAPILPVGPPSGPGGGGALLGPIAGPGGVFSPIVRLGGLLAPIAGPGRALGPIGGPGSVLATGLTPAGSSAGGGTSVIGRTLPVPIGTPGGPSGPSGPSPLGGSLTTIPPSTRSSAGGGSLTSSIGDGAPMSWALLAGIAPRGAAAGTSAPVSPSTPQQAPDGALGAGSTSATSLYLAGFAALLLVAAWALPRLARRLDAASALWRPMPFVALLERPG